jgi:hypothetical protein
MPRLRSLFFFTLLPLAACGGSAMLTSAGPKQPSRGEHCEFQVLTASPGAGFVELGTIDVRPGSFGTNIFRNLADFKSRIEPLVCAAGGDAALASANGYGMYIQATVLKSVASAASVARATEAPSAGCQFDTQCKGARVCVKGECEEPVTK